jgi:multiple antibiotic resistance protein
VSILGLTPGEVFALLFIAMGPLRVTIVYMPIAYHLPPDIQRKLALRTVLVGLIVAVAVILLGFGIVQNFHLNLAVLLLAAGLTYIVLAFPVVLAGPSDIVPPPPVKDPLRLAISPLAVPVMITPLGIATLLSASAFVSDWVAILIFLSLVVAMLVINFVVMVLSTRLAQYITRPILEVFQKIFGFVLLAFGLQLIVRALTHLGVITVKGF